MCVVNHVALIICCIASCFLLVWTSPSWFQLLWLQAGHVVETPTTESILSNSNATPITPSASPTGPMAKLKRSTSSLKGKWTNVKGNVKDAMRGRKGTRQSQPNTPSAVPNPESNSAGVPVRRKKTRGMREAAVSVKQKLAPGRCK